MKRDDKIWDESFVVHGMIDLEEFELLFLELRVNSVHVTVSIDSQRSWGSCCKVTLG